jgi:hypothetical protein
MYRSADVLGLPVGVTIMSKALDVGMPARARIHSGEP